MAWQADLLEDVRRSHFHLMGFSFALLVAATLLPSASLEAAYQQVRTIDTVRGKYLNYESLGQRAATQEIDLLFTADTYQVTPRMNAVSEEIVTRLTLTVDGSTARIGTYGWEFPTVKTRGNKWPASVFSNTNSLRIQTLDQFRVAWDFLANAYLARIDEVDFDEARAFSFGEAVDLAPHLSPGQTDPEVYLSAKFGIREEVSTTRSFAPRVWFVVIEFDSATGIDLPFDEIHVPIRIAATGKQGAQSLVVPGEDFGVPLGEFRTSFADLAGLSVGLESLKIEPLLSYVQRLRDESDQHIQLLGVDIPRTVISQWGVILLIAVQLYFFLHVQHLRRQALSAHTVATFPWLGLYPDRVSVAVFTASISILPAVAALLLVWSGASTSASNSKLVFLGASALSSVAITTLIVINARNLPTYLLGRANGPASTKDDVGAAADD